ncbi:MAG: FAD-dependent oxidoreductase [Lachnospiraceae bacterium]|nr:FAD-dependent oxidoreductase [Lachnospiraceae bacterium]
MPDGSMDEALLMKKAAAILHVPPKAIQALFIRRRSIDARKKPQIFYIFSVDVVLSEFAEEQVLSKGRNADCQKSPWVAYEFPKEGRKEMQGRPVIVGMGPAGLFCAYELALHGYRPILLERGKCVEERTEDVARFWREGVLLPESNVQFGEGGAGAFSDGKLNTLIKDKDGRCTEVLGILCAHGAKKEICYDHKPHIGTDALCEVVRNMRKTIAAHGGEIRFETRLSGLRIENGKVTGVSAVCDGQECDIACGSVVLAIGHSARDTVQMLYDSGIEMEAKPFAVGLRVEHPQALIDQSQYGKTEAGILGAAAYKLTAQTKSGRGVYTFCMCPGGYVVNASSEPDMLAVNGMSYSGRDGSNANSAVIVTVTPEDYGDTHPLSGIAFQRDLERRAYEIGKGSIPVQRYGDFKAEVLAQAVQSEKDTGNISAFASFEPCIKGRYTYANVSAILPRELSEAFVEGMEAFGRKIPHYNDARTLLEGVESRTSSPVRILRNEELVCRTADNLYPCGEGAGYAGGIMSAAMDGVRVAEAIAEKYRCVP